MKLAVKKKCCQSAHVDAQARSDSHSVNPDRVNPDRVNPDRVNPDRIDVAKQPECDDLSGEGGSITGCIKKLRDQADPDAATQLYDRYFEHLANRLHRRISRWLQSVSDSHDVAQYVLAEVLRKLELGLYPQLNDRDSLLALMMAVAKRHYAHVWRQHTAVKRNCLQRVTLEGEGEVGESPLGNLLIETREMAPDFLVQWEDLMEKMASKLGPDYRSVLTWQLEGHTPSEILTRLGAEYGTQIGDRSLRRRFEAIRDWVDREFLSDAWSGEGQTEQGGDV